MLSPRKVKNLDGLRILLRIEIEQVVSASETRRLFSARSGGGYGGPRVDSFLLEVNLIGSMSSSDNRKFNLIHFS